MISALLGGYVPGVSISGALSASAAPTTVSGASSLMSVTTGSCTCTAAGGTAPYGFLWKAADYSEDAISPMSPTSATTTFRGSGMVSGEDRQAFFYCQVTDALGSVVPSNVITASVSRA